MSPYADKGACPKFTSYSSAVTEGWRTLASRTLPGVQHQTCCPCEGESFRSDHGCGLGLPSGSAPAPTCHPFPKCLVLLPSTAQPQERGVVSWRSCPGQSGQPWAAVTALVLRQLCKAGREPAPRSSCCCPAPPPCLGHFLLPFCSKLMNIFFLDELAQSPASYGAQILNP